MNLFKKKAPPPPTYRALTTQVFGIGRADYALVRGETVEIGDPNAVAILLDGGYIEVVES